jgi:hypothetical protein
MTKFLSLLAIALAGAYVFITLDLLFGYTLLVLFYPQIKNKQHTIIKSIG